MRLGKLAAVAGVLCIACALISAAPAGRKPKKRATPIQAVQDELAELRQQVADLSRRVEAIENPPKPPKHVMRPQGVTDQDVAKAIAKGKPIVGMTMDEADRALSDRVNDAKRITKSESVVNGRIVSEERWEWYFMTLQFRNGMLVKVTDE